MTLHLLTDNQLVIKMQGVVAEPLNDQSEIYDNKAELLLYTQGSSVFNKASTNPIDVCGPSN